MYWIMSGNKNSRQTILLFQKQFYFEIIDGNIIIIVFQDVNYKHIVRVYAGWQFVRVGYFFPRVSGIVIPDQVG